MKKLFLIFILIILGNHANAAIAGPTARFIIENPIIGFIILVLCASLVYYLIKSDKSE